MPNWIWRPGFELVMRPKVPEPPGPGTPLQAGPQLKLGGARIGVLVTLINWAMTASVVFSPRLTCLPRLRSAVANPGPRNAPAAQLPKVPGAAALTEAGFQNWMPVTPPMFTSCPLPDCETPPLQLGR